VEEGSWSGVSAGAEGFDVARTPPMEESSDLGRNPRVQNAVVYACMKYFEAKAHTLAELVTTP
jgi:hypothetical protein